jgi:hypothetical protein
MALFRATMARLTTCSTPLRAAMWPLFACIIFSATS